MSEELKKHDDFSRVDYILEMRAISKRFPGVQALDNVTIQCRKGEVIALVGENGAGKTTLMNILVGALQPDGGEIILRGNKVEINNPHEGISLGISIIYQEFNLIPNLSIAENIYLGRLPRRGMFVSSEMFSQADRLLESLGVTLDPRTPVQELSVSQQQMVEIAKALSYHADIIVMDEPSASIPDHELESLFKRIGILRNKGITIIYISHRLKEIFEIADRVTVLKDGKLVGTIDVGDANIPLLIQMMVGRPMVKICPPKTGRVEGKVFLDVKGLSKKGQVSDISFNIHKGEILGIFGLMGSGRTELAKIIFGAETMDEGKIYLDGKEVHLDNPKMAIESGIGFLTEDRKNEGLVMDLSIRNNITLPSADRIRKLRYFVDKKKEDAIATDLVDELAIRTPSIEQKVMYLSGGNQQKVILAKWLSASPKLIIFDEPTRGIDIGTKAEVYYLMRELTQKGTSILMISSELPEILGMCDRILVMKEGRITGELPGDEATEEKVMYLATGVEPEVPDVG